jgi:7-alpha-hydroxysteroid dehydrogenase
VDAFDRVDILVNAARLVTGTAPLDAEDNSVEELMQQNLMMPLRLSQAVGRRFVKQKAPSEDGPIGSIVNLSSIAGQRAHPDLMGFSIANAALDQMTRSMAVALAPQQIRVNGVSVGSVLSNNLLGWMRDNENAREAIIDATPMGRLANAAEVGDTVQYLASDASGFVTGQIVTLDGGRTLVDPAAIAVH